MSRDSTCQHTSLTGSKMGAACNTVSYEEQVKSNTGKSSSSNYSSSNYSSSSSSSSSSRSRSIPHNLVPGSTQRKNSRRAAVLWSTPKFGPPAARKAASLDATTSVTATPTPTFKTDGPQKGGTVGGLGGGWAGWSWGGGDADANTDAIPAATATTAAAAAATAATTAAVAATGCYAAGEPERTEGKKGCQDDGWEGGGTDSLMC